MPLVSGVYFFSVSNNLLLKPKIILCIASIAFYSFMALNYTPLMLSSIIINYIVGNLLSKAKKKKWLVMGVSFNLLVIFFFKYYDLIFFHVLGTSSILYNQVIPLGISFYTFTQIAYLVDTYYGNVHKNNDFISYCLFVTYFPHLIAGPVIHHKNMLEQFAEQKNYNVNYANIFQGLSFFIIGLSKKVLIADSLIPYIKPTFHAVYMGEYLYPLECWCGIIAYSFQIYFDFSGYSDMAVGISKCFNFNLPYNFNSPYKSINIIEFWRRWHISLSLFLRDYLYIPLGGSRKGSLRRYINLLLTMLIGGVWHGANLTFILWGGYHGLLLIVNHLINASKNFPQAIFLNKISTFFLVAMGWVFFRSETVSSALSYYKILFSFHEFFLLPDAWSFLCQYFPLSSVSMSYFYGKYEILILTIYGVIAFLLPNSQELVEKLSSHIEKGRSVFLYYFFMIIMFFLCLYKMDDLSEFIYFQF